MHEHGGDMVHESCDGSTRAMPAVPMTRAPGQRRRSLCPLALALGLLVGADPAARAQSSLGLEGGLFFDSGARVDEVGLAALTDTDRHDVTNRDVGHLALYYLYALSDTPREGMRLGGELRYLGTLATEEGDEAEVVGTLLEIGARAEWSTHLTDALVFFAGARASLALAFPSGDLAREIDRMQGDGVPVSHGPRPGVTLMPNLGAGYVLHERVTARLSLGLGWSWLSIFDVDERVSGIRYMRRETLSSTRFDLTLGVEISL